MKAFYENRKHRANSGFLASYVESLTYVAHWHEEIELLYVIDGQIGVGLNKDYRVLQQGDISISASNGIHYYNSEGMKSRSAMIIFKPDRLAFEALGLESVDLVSFFIDGLKDENDKKLIEYIIKEIVDENDNKEHHYKQFISLKLTELILFLFRKDSRYYLMCENAKSLAIDPSLVPMQKAIKYLESNYMEEVSLESVANEAGLSPYYFSRLFKKTTGTNYKTYLNQIRIDSAEHLIKTTNEHIIDIAYKTGFKSIRTFNRVYKNMRGHVPQSIRK